MSLLLNAAAEDGMGARGKDRVGTSQGSLQGE